MFTHDVVAPIWRRRAERAAERPLSPWVGKAFVVALALIGLAIAYRPPASFRVIATQTFTGLAVLFPVVIGALYWKRMTSVGGAASILVGEGLVAAYYFKLLPTFGTLPVIPILVGGTVVLIVVSLLTHAVSWRRPCRRWIPMSRRAKVGWTLAFCALFFLGNDVWNWGSDRLWLLGFPWWLWMFAGLCVLTAAAFWFFARGATKCETDTRAVE